MASLRRAFCIAAMMAAAVVAASPTSAQQPWPSRFVRLVVAGGSGTSADVAARVVSHHLAELWGQQVIVENRPGAGGVAGAASIAQSIPDGYSLLFSQSAPLSLSPHVVKPVPYDVERDFEPVIFIGMVPFVLASNEKLPVGNLAEFIAYARKEPGKVSFATSAAGSAPHLAAVLFQRMAGMQMVHVPYVGYPRAIQDTLSGFVDVIFANPQIIQSQTGKLRMLGVTTANRVADHPDIPAIAEALPGFAISGWVAVLAPKGTPPALVAKINADVAAVLSIAEVTKRLRDLGVYPDLESLGTPQALMQFIRQDSALMESLIKAAGIKAEGGAPN